MELEDRARRFVKPFCVKDGKDFHLKDIDPASTGNLESEDEDRAREVLQEGIELLADYQSRLYAQNRWAVLLIFQGMDAAGKDGAIKQVLAGINPAGSQVFAFKAPSEAELDHDFLWRAARVLPERGRIGIFNRSYYEEVVTVRIHPEFLEKQRLPPRCVGKGLWDDRLEDIRSFERYLARNGVLIRKFFLHVSRDEQKTRFLERIDEPEKHWKFNERDVAERAHWDAYQQHWSHAIAETSTAHAPWLVVPADKKWFTRLVLAEALVSALEDLELDFPRLEGPRKQELARARKTLEAEAD